jgi:hypothetical protein
MIEAVAVDPADLLDTPDAQVVRRRLHARHARCARSPIARENCGATVLTKAVTSAVSGNSCVTSWTSRHRWL